MAEGLQYYVACFRQLNCNKRHGEVAPHKAVLLLAVMEEVKAGHISNGFIPLNDSMAKAFKREWDRYVGTSVWFNPVFATPFFHMDYEPFWELMKREPFEACREYTLPMLRKNFYGAKIPEELCEYMAEEASRLQLKKALLEMHFPEHCHDGSQSLAADPENDFQGGADGIISDLFVA